ASSRSLYPRTAADGAESGQILHYHTGILLDRQCYYLVRSDVYGLVCPRPTFRDAPNGLASMLAGRNTLLFLSLNLAQLSAGDATLSKLSAVLRDNGISGEVIDATIQSQIIFGTAFSRQPLKGDMNLKLVTLNTVTVGLVNERCRLRLAARDESGVME